MRRLLALYRAGGDCASFLAGLPPYAATTTGRNASASLQRLRRHINSIARSTVNSPSAVQMPAALAETSYYPLVVLAEAMGRSTTIPAAFWLDNTYSLVNSLLHKDLRVVLTNIPVRGAQQFFKHAQQNKKSE